MLQRKLPAAGLACSTVMRQAERPGQTPANEVAARQDTRYQARQVCPPSPAPPPGTAGAPPPRPLQAALHAASASCGAGAPGKRCERNHCRSPDPLPPLGPGGATPGMPRPEIVRTERPVSRCAWTALWALCARAGDLQAGKGPRSDGLTKRQR